MRRRSNPRFMDMMSLKEACRLFGVPYHVLWQDAYDGRLMCEHFAHMYATTAAWVEVYLERYHPTRLGTPGPLEIDAGTARVRVLRTVTTREMERCA